MAILLHTVSLLAASYTVTTMSCVVLPNSAQEQVFAECLALGFMGFPKITKSCSCFSKILPTTVGNKGRLYGK